MSRQRDWQKKQNAAGNCLECGKPLDSTSKRFCLRCLKKTRDAVNARNKLKRVRKAYSRGPYHYTYRPGRPRIKPLSRFKRRPKR